MTGALEEAFRRVGVSRPAPSRPMLVAPRPAPSSIPRRETSYKARLLEDKAAFDAMSDDELELEFISLAENLEAIRIELRLHSEGAVEHVDGWRPRAERATAIIRARLSLCTVERVKRHAAAKELRRGEENPPGEKQRRWEAQRAADHARRLERIAAATREDKEHLQAFKDHAKAMLPAETYQAIWDAVGDGLAGGAQ